MKGIPVSDVRNFAIFGHTGSGKTTLVDSLCFKLGLNDRLGSVAAGSSMADYTDTEKNRKITIAAKPFQASYKTKAGKPIGLTFIDTPGYLDFFGQVISAARACDLGLFAVDAVSGVQVGTRRAWECCEESGVKARAIVVTGLDKENADFAAAVEQIRGAFGEQCVPATIPLPGLKGVADVLNPGAGSEALAVELEEARTGLTEKAAETDDKLIEKYLGGEALTPAELSSGMRTAVAKGYLVPIFACVASKELGLAELLEGIAALFPSPDARPFTDAQGTELKVDAGGSFVGFVWRAVNDPFVGQLSLVRVLSGTLRADSEVYNAVKGQNERIANVLVVNGKKQTPVEEASAGDIVALTKLKVTRMNDTLCAPGHKVICPELKFPSPVAFSAVTAQTQADEDKIGTALSRVCEEDPTLHVDRNRETHEMVLQGMGDVHIDVAVELMRTRSNVKVTLSTPKVPYRETVMGRAEGHYKHKKQSGGRGQFGEVYLRVAPKAKDDPEWFEDAVVGGVIPNNFIPAVQKGAVERMESGALGGFHVQDIKVTLYDGSFHPVDSSEIAFKIAGSRALREAMLAAKPVLLEPIMTVKVAIPDSHMGDINGDLNHKRGRILGLEPKGHMQVITAEVPQAELFRYAAELRSMTGGQGTFEMTFARYDVVPSNVAQKVLAEVKKKEEEEE